MSFKKEPERRLYLTYAESRTGGEICAGQENDPWPSHETEFLEVNFSQVLTRSQPVSRFFYHSEEVSKEVWTADRVWMVVVRYTDGGTFGQSSGYWEIQGLFCDEERARAWARVINLDNQAYIHFGGRKKSVFPGHQAWKGYFAHLDDVEVHEMQVADGEKEG